MHSESHPTAPLYGVAEAICLLAQEPLEAPSDPCSVAIDDLPQQQTSRWLLSYLPALRALASWAGEGDPPAPVGWREFEPRLNLRPAESLWRFDLDQIWLDRVAAMRGLCIKSGASAATWATRWARHEAAAMAHFEASERRNDAMTNAAATLHSAVVSNGGIPVVGRDVRTGRRGEIPREATFDRNMEWTSDRNAWHRDGLVLFTGGMRTSTAEYIDITFAAADIEALMARGGRPSAAPVDRTLAGAVRRAALEEFPGGPPVGMSAKTRNARIRARMAAMGAKEPCERTIRDGIRGLWAPPGASRRRS